MLVKGDVKCLHCGFISGQWVGVNGAPLLQSGLSSAAPGPHGTDSPVRCARCAGPVFLDDVDPVISSSRLRRIRRLREQLAALDGRKGRAA